MGSVGVLVILILAGIIVLVGVYDLFQTRHAILRNFPIIGHLRYLLEKLGPELRQYIVADNDEERPFNRDQICEKRILVNKLLDKNVCF